MLRSVYLLVLGLGGWFTGLIIVLVALIALDVARIGERPETVPPIAIPAVEPIAIPAVER